MKKLKESNGVTLEDLFNCVWQMTNTIEEFNHVSDYIPKSLINEINKFKNKLDNELDERQK